MQSIIWLDSAFAEVDGDSVIIYCRSGNNVPVVRMPRGAFRAYIETSIRMLNDHERAERDVKSNVVEFRRR